MSSLPDRSSHSNAVKDVLMRNATIFALPVVAACATASSAGPSPHERVLARTDAEVVRSYESPQAGTVFVRATPAQALTALKAAYNEVGIDVKLWDTSRGQVGNENFSRMYRLGRTPLSEYVGCGITSMGAAADSYRVTMSLVSQVTDVPDGARIDTQLLARADDLASSKGQISCLTRGTLETKVNELATNHLGG